MKDKFDIIRDIASFLPNKEQNDLLNLISEISEKSYRRAVQQTIHLIKNGKIDEWIFDDEGYSFRFEKSLKVSIGLDGFTTSSKERLLMEEPDLKFLEN